VPRRSEREEIASRYWASMVVVEVRVPYGGSRELRPESGGGGGLSMGWIEWADFEFGSGERKEKR